jgi:hypothetical protein
MYNVTAKDILLSKQKVEAEGHNLHFIPSTGDPQLKNCFNMTFPSAPSSPKWPLPFMSPDHNFLCICHLSDTCHMPLLFHRRKAMDQTSRSNDCHFYFPLERSRVQILPHRFTILT